MKSRFSTWASQRVGEESPVTTGWEQELGTPQVQSCHLVSMIPQAPLTTQLGWECRLPIQPLWLLMMVGLQVFLWYLTGVELLLSKSFVLLDCSLPCPLTSECKLLGGFFFCSCWLSWVAGFSSIHPGTYMAVRDPREFNTTHGSWGPLPVCLFLPFRVFFGLLYM